MDKLPEKIGKDVESIPRGAKPRKSGKRDLRELARSLGLGDAHHKSIAAKGSGEAKKGNFRILAKVSSSCIDHQALDWEAKRRTFNRSELSPAHAAVWPPELFQSRIWLCVRHAPRFLH